MSYKNVDMVFVCRGRPGLGHITPSVAIAQHLSSTIDYCFITYDTGPVILKERGMPFIRIEGPPLGQRLSPFFDFMECKKNIWPFIKKLNPTVVVTDGEYYLPHICRENKVKNTIITTRHYLEGNIGQYKKYFDVIKILFRAADRIFYHGLKESDETRISAEFAGQFVGKFQKVKEEDVITVSTGGGNLDHMKKNDDAVFEKILEIKGFKFNLFTGATGRFSRNIIEEFCRGRAVIARAGLVTLEELLYLGKPSVLLVPKDDEEKFSNACLAEKIGLGIKIMEDEYEEGNFKDILKKVMEKRPIASKSNGAAHVAKILEDII
ncbi:MAG: glycosyltransferase [Candidatus Aenigmatarchaeota archaeon]